MHVLQTVMYLDTGVVGGVDGVVGKIESSY